MVYVLLKMKTKMKMEIAPVMADASQAVGCTVFLVRYVSFRRQSDVNNTNSNNNNNKHFPFPSDKDLEAPKVPVTPGG